jgi:hypothetical protein
VEKEEKVIVEIKEQGKETGACRRKEDRDREVRNETDGRQREWMSGRKIWREKKRYAHNKERRCEKLREVELLGKKTIPRDGMVRMSSSLYRKKRLWMERKTYSGNGDSIGVGVKCYTVRKKNLNLSKYLLRC